MKTKKLLLGTLLFTFLTCAFFACEKNEEMQFVANNNNIQKTIVIDNPFKMGEYHNMCLETLAKRNDFYEIYSNRNVLHEITCEVLQHEIPFDSTYIFSTIISVEDYAITMKNNNLITNNEFDFLIFLNDVITDSTSSIIEMQQTVQNYINTISDFSKEENFNIVSVGAIFIESIEYWDTNSEDPNVSKWINKEHFPYIYSLYELRNSKLPWGYLHKLGMIAAHDCLSYLDCRVEYDDPNTPWDNAAVRDICLENAWISSGYYAQTR